MFFDLPFVTGARLTGLFERDRLLSASDSESDAFPGLKIAENREDMDEPLENKKTMSGCTC